MKKPVRTVESSDPQRFEQECEKLVTAGYKLASSSVGFVNSEEYAFCSSYQAIFVLPKCVANGCGDK